MTSEEKFSAGGRQGEAEEPGGSRWREERGPERHGCSDVAEKREGKLGRWEQREEGREGRRP